MVMGLLDFSNLSPQDQKLANLGLLGTMIGAGTLASGGGNPLQQIGAGIGSGIGAYGQMQQANQIGQLRQMQMADIKRKQEQAEAQRKAIQGMFQAPPSQLAMAGSGRPGPTPQAAQAMTPAVARMFPGADVGALKAYAEAFPEQFSEVMGKQIMGPDPSKRYQNVNGQLVDLHAPGGPRIALSVPEQMKPPPNTMWIDQNDPSKGVRAIPGANDAVAAAEAAKFNATLSGRLRVAEAGRSQVTVDNRGEMEEQKQFGADLVKEYGAIRERATAAEEQRNQIRMARAFSDTDAQGRELPSVLQQKAGNAAVALGFDVNTPAFRGVLGRISDGQSFVGTMENLVLTKMQAQKGPQTENDAKRIQQTVASLGNTPEARDFLLRAADALSFEDQIKRQHWDEHMTAKKTFAGAAKSWTEFRNSVPFMGISPNTKKPVFFAEFYEANRGKSPSEVIAAWKQQYGR